MSAPLSVSLAQPKLACPIKVDLIPSWGQGYFCIQISGWTRIRAPFQKSNFYITQQAEIYHAAYIYKNMMTQGLYLAVNKPLAIHQLSTSCIWLQLPAAISTVSNQFKRVQKRNFVYQISRMRLRTYLSTSQTLGATSCSQLQQATGISGVSDWIEMVQKGMLVYLMSRMELEAQPAPSLHLASCQLSLNVASQSQIRLSQLSQVGYKWLKREYWFTQWQNGTRDIASQKLATRCHQLQLILAIYGSLTVSGLIEMVQKRKLSSQLVE